MSFRYGQHWARTRAAIRRRDRGVCVRCGNPFTLSVHHLDGNRRNNANENLVTLCMGCHNEMELLIETSAAADTPLFGSNPCP